MVELELDDVDVGLVLPEPLDGGPGVSVGLAHQVGVVALVHHHVAARLKVVDVRRN